MSAFYLLSERKGMVSFSGERQLKGARKWLLNFYRGVSPRDVSSGANNGARNEIRGNEFTRQANGFLQGRRHCPNRPFACDASRGSCERDRVIQSGAR